METSGSNEENLHIWQQMPTVGSLVLRPGSLVFGRFLLEKELGRGSHGMVCLALDQALQEKVALKFVPDHLRFNPLVMDVVRKEVRQTRQLVHSNIVRLFELHEDASCSAVAMEYVSGGSLADKCLASETGVMKPEDILLWLPGICAALDYAHKDAGIVHRDIKPGNVLLTAEGGAKLADFGLARSLAEQTSCMTGWQPSGTLAFMSPQQLMGEPPAGTDDLYSLGCLLYTILCGSPPFLGGHLPSQILEKIPDHPGEVRKRLSQNISELPEFWCSAILACLEKEPQLRPQSGAELMDRLNNPLRYRSRWQHLRQKLPRSRLTHRATSSRWITGVLAASVVAVVLTGIGINSTQRQISIESSSLESAQQLLSGPLLNPAPNRLNLNPTYLFGALAHNLLLHLPLQNDTLDYGGSGWHGTGVGLSWAEDRFGREKQAVQFMGNSHVRITLDPEYAFSVGRPFSLSIWFQPDLQGGTLWSLIPSSPEFAHLIMDIEEDTLRLTIGGNYRDIISMNIPDRIVPWQWHYLVCQFDGEKIVVYLDGEEVLSSEVHLDNRLTTGWNLRLGGIGARRRHFEGSMNDLRLYRSAIPQSQILTNFRYGPHRAKDADATLPQSIQRYVLTTGMYHETDDLEAAVQKEFGPDATIAEWNEIRGDFYDHGRKFAEILGLGYQTSAFITRNGRRFFDGTRQYMIFPNDGVELGTGLFHDYTADRELLIGSWFNLYLPILARLPDEEPSDFRFSELAVSTMDLPRTIWRWSYTGEESSIQPVITSIPGEEAVSMTKELPQDRQFTNLRVEFTGTIHHSEWGNQLGIRLQCRNLKIIELVVGHFPARRSSLEVKITDGTDHFDQALVPAHFGQFKFTALVRARRVYFSAMSMQSPETLFERTVEIPDLCLSDIQAVEWFVHAMDADIAPNQIGNPQLTAR